VTSLKLSQCRLVVTMDDHGTEVPDATIAIRDRWITAVGSEPSEEQFDQVIDGRRLIALPGLVNAHHHLFQTLTRGFPESEGITLFPWLQRLYPIWAGLDDDMIYASTRTGLAELALSGCTTSSDHLYVFPDGSEGFMDAQVEAARSVGLRFHATRGSMDLGRSAGGLPPDSVVQSRDAIMRDSERAIHRFHDPEPGAMTRIGLAPCSPFSATPELMKESAALAREEGVRLHTHIAETMDENAFSRDAFGLSPVELLESVGWAESDVWVAHCVHPSESDIEILASRDVAVAHCPTSNMLLGSGLAPVFTYMQKRIGVGLGVDGSASNDANDLRQEVKQAVLVARARDGASAMSVRDALRLATRGGASCLGREDIGSIQPGKVADIALFDAESLALAGAQEDLIAGIVLGAPRPVAVLVNGEFVVRDGALVRCDSGELSRAQNTAARRLMRRANELAATLR
jgi:cytosine/adenosine deaminase-related metal-dependent hydrolase